MCLQWWGRSRSKKFSIEFDEIPVAAYIEENDPGYNSWQTFDGLDSVGERLVLNLTEGELGLGIRQIQIRMV